MTQANAPWPDGCQGAVSLTFDDGMASQLDLAVPLLDEHNLQATFYINPRDGYTDTLAAWRPVATTGHELGNHTIRHPCSKNFAFIADTDRLALEDMSMAEMEAEIVETSRRIRELAPAQVNISFGYPCYQPFLGQGHHHQSYVPLVARHCVGGRGRGEYANHPRHCDLAYLWSWPCERKTGAELIGLAERAASQGRWAILTFHGIQEGHLAIGAGDFAELCTFLARQQERIWTAPVAVTAQRLQTWRGRLRRVNRA